MEKVVMQIRLVHIKEVRYSCDLTNQLPENFKDKKIKVGLSFAINPDIKNNLLELVVGVNYHCEPDCIVEEVLHYKISVLFNVANIAEFVELKNQSIRVSPELISILLGVSIGSLRGMLVLKTNGTILDEYPLPIINISELISGTHSNPLQDRVISPIFQFKFE